MDPSITAADFLALARECKYDGAEADIEAQRACIVNSKKSVKRDGVVLDIKAIVVEKAEDQGEIVIKASPRPQPQAVPRSASVNGTDDTQTIVDAAVTKRLAEMGVDVKRANFRGAASDVEISVKSVEEAIYERYSTKHFKTYESANRFRDYFLSVLGRTPQYAGMDFAVNAQKRWNDSPATKKMAAGAEFKSYLAGLHPDMKAYTSSTQAGGGALTFMEFIPDLIQNVLQYGAARRVAQVWPMSQEQAVIPKMSGIHTLTYPQQAATAAQSTGVTYSNVNLSAKTGICIVKLAKQLVQDANILVVDNVMEQIARTVAFTEEQEAFTANSESTLAGCIGVIPRMNAVSATLAAAGNTLGSSAPNNYTMAHFTSCMASLPNYARQNAVWVCNPVRQDNMIRLGMAQGGVTWKETVDNGYTMFFLGKPVVEANVMPTTNAQYTIHYLFGDFKRGLVIGDRMGLELDATDVRYWDDFAIGVRGVIRHDVVAHDVGTLATAGPIVCMAQAS